MMAQNIRLRYIIVTVLPINSFFRFSNLNTDLSRIILILNNNTLIFNCRMSCLLWCIKLTNTNKKSLHRALIRTPLTIAEFSSSSINWVFNAVLLRSSLWLPRVKPPLLPASSMAPQVSVIRASQSFANKLYLYCASSCIESAYSP